MTGPGLTVAALLIKETHLCAFVLIKTIFGKKKKSIFQFSLVSKVNSVSHPQTQQSLL